MNFSPHNTITVIGSSEDLYKNLDIFHNLKKVSLIYPTIGINGAGVYLDFVDYVGTVEKETLNCYNALQNSFNNAGKLIVCFKNNVPDYEFIRERIIYDFTFSNNMELDYDKHKLLFNTSSLHPIINWCVLNKFLNIVLIGVRLERNWTRFCNNNGNYQPSFFIENARKYLYLQSKYCNLFCCNENTFDKKCIESINIYELFK